MKKFKGTFALLSAALVWGIAFVAQSSASDDISSFTFNAVRCTLATGFLFVLMLVSDFADKKRGKEKPKAGVREIITGGIISGVTLFAGMNLQQFGIAAYPEGVASSGRAGFLTATYVVMTAVVTWIITKKVRVLSIVAAVICMAGLYLLCLGDGLSKIYMGDLLVLLCAVVFTAYFFIIDKYNYIGEIRLSFAQFLVTTVLSFICAFIFENPQWEAVRASWVEIVYSGIISGGIGYTLQIVGQKTTKPAVASIVISLESVFAALAGWVILSERLSIKELFGCILVFVAVILAQVSGFAKKEHT